jgi:hypothetical protein
LTPGLASTLPPRGRGKNEREQHPLDGDVAVACLGRDLLGLVEQPQGLAVDAGCLRGARAGHGGDLGERFVGGAAGRVGAAAGAGDQPGGHALLVFEQRFQQVDRRNALMIVAGGDRLRRLQKAAGTLREFLEVHKAPVSPSGVDLVWHFSNTRARRRSHERCRERR